MANVKEVFQRAVKAIVNGDKNHGWGNDDSVKVLIALIADNAGCDEKDIADDAEFVGALKEVVNPSQFRQKLETAGILAKGATRKEKVNNLLADFDKA